MGDVVTFIGKVKAPVRPGPFTCSLNRALLAVQYAALVLHDDATACGLLQCLGAQQEPLRDVVTLPGTYREVVENLDTKATYRAVMGVTDDD